MGLGDSPKPLTEDVVKIKPLTVAPTFAEWVSDGNAEQIILFKQQTGAGNTEMYKVPDNFTLFITNATLNTWCTAGAPSARRGAISFRADTNFILSVLLVAGNSSENISQIFTMPIRVNSGDIIRVSSFAGSNTLALIKGFLLPRKISIR